MAYLKYQSKSGGNHQQSMAEIIEENLKWRKNKQQYRNGGINGVMKIMW
jgi:hypothetical protein